MLLELSEVLACPLCGPPQVMVAVVHESVGRRVRNGFLGCPACDSRYPVQEGTVLLTARPEDAPPEDAVEPTGSLDLAPSEGAVLLGAVLDLASRPGYVLLGPGLESLAGATAAINETCEVVSLATSRELPADGTTDLSRIVGCEVETLPVLSGRFTAAALAGDPGTRIVLEFARALGPRGRLAVIQPSPGAARAMREAGLEVIAADPRVAVASKGP
jgi:uncharacterized protein YbaR (Trm112 family)